MSDRTKLLKKAVLTGVGATSSVDRVKDALKEAMQDLVKVGQDLLDDLEEKGKIKTESAQSFLKGFQDEAAKRTEGIEKKVSNKVGKELKKVARDLGVVTYDKYEALLERVAALEAHVGITTTEHIEEGECSGECEDHEVTEGHEVETEEHEGGGKKKRGKKNAE